MKPFVLRYEERIKYRALMMSMLGILNSEANATKLGPQTGTSTFTKIKSESADTDRATCACRIFYSESI